VLPFEAEPGLVFYAVDLRGYRGEFMTLDYGSSGEHRRPTVYAGRSVDLAAVGLQPLRKFEGWRT
jgi:hypothetical protein